MKKTIAVILLLFIFFVLVLTSVSTKTPVCDAAAHHIGSGYSFVKTGDFRMNPSAPPLLRLLMGLPLLPLDLKLPTDHPSWQTINSMQFHYQFLFVYNNNAEKIVFLSRLPMIFLSTIFGLAIFMWSKRLYGYNAGLFSLFLFVFSPAMLANGGLAMLDMGCAFFIFLFVFQLWRYLHNRSRMNLILAGICFGLAQSTKITAIVLYPMTLVFFVTDAIYSNRKGKPFLLGILLRDIITIWIIGLFVLWATYFFEFKPLLENAPDVDEKIEYMRKFSSLIPFVNSAKLANALIYFGKNIPIPLSTYIVTLLGVIHIAMSNYPLYFMGKVFCGGSRIYYLVDYLIKTPLAMVILIILSAVMFKKRKRAGFMAEFFLIFPIITFFAFASKSKLQGGLRYLLPMYPFLFVWVGNIVNHELIKKSKGFKAALIFLCSWYLITSASAYPHYLAYFNELTGGPGGFGYKITKDSDWGQDFKALKSYLDKKKIKEVRLICFGTIEPSYYGIRYVDVESNEYKKPKPGAYYAISSRYLPGVEWAEEREPVDRVAHNIFIYYIEEAIK
ncbi:MAG: glycosyltransferase family 39 protein [Candidatus Omnitrophota bacterium]